MAYVLAGVLLVAAVATLTLPWARRDPDDFTLAELGYAWRGPRGAIIGALRALVQADVVRLSRVRGVVRTDKPAPADTDRFIRVVYGTTDLPRSPGTLRELPSVTKALPPVAERVLAAGLRVGWPRRLVGSCVALAAPVVVLVAHRDVAGIVLGVVAILVAGWLIVLRGTTIAGIRTLAAAPAGSPAPRGSGRSGGSVGFAVLTGGTYVPVCVASPEGSFGWGSDFGGGSDSGGGGDSGSGY